jgi:hypothetical protein
LSFSTVMPMRQCRQGITSNIARNNGHKRETSQVFR